MIDNPGYDWMFITAPQANAHGRTFAWPRGKVLGGTSAINGAMLWHPSKWDLDSWERLVNKGRNFKTRRTIIGSSKLIYRPQLREEST